MKKITAVFVLFLVSGCATSTRYTSEPLQSADSASSGYRLKVQLEKQITPGLFSTEVKNEVYLYVNDVLTVRGPLHRDESGQLQGNYESKPVQLDCIKPGIFRKTQCTVHIDGKNAGSLSLDIVL